MPYYTKANNHPTRDQKRRLAEQRGGFDDEGARYSPEKKGGTNKRAGEPAGKRKEYRSDGRKGPGPDHNKKTQSDGYKGPSSDRRTDYHGDSRKAPRSDDRRNGQGDGYKGPNSDRRTDYRGDSRKATRPDDRRNGQGDGYKAPSSDRRTDYRGDSRKAPRPEDRRNGQDDGYKGPNPDRRRDYRSNSRKDVPADHRPIPTRDNGKPNGEFRFAPKNVSPYRSRGEQITPKPYDVRRREYKQAYRSPLYFANRTDTPVAEPANENLLSGRNPIREALKSGRDIEKLMIAKGELSGSAKEIVAMAREQRVPVQEVDRARLDAITPNHQGMLAFASAYRYHTVEEMLELAKSRGEKPFLVMLDGVTDPHNLGAVIRTAECAGAHGVIVQERRAVGLTPAAVKASAGAIEHIMVARVVNLADTLESLKKQGIWTYAADPKGEDYAAVDFSGGAVIVIGSEGDGISRLVAETCDKTVALPVRGQIGSLNASVAAGILLYAVLRSR